MTEGGGALHELAVAALLDVLENNQLRDRALLLSAAPPPPIAELFYDNVRPSLFRGVSSRRSEYALAREHLQTRALTTTNAVEQLQELGLDGDAFANRRLFAVMRDSSVLGVRTMALQHLHDVQFGQHCVRRVPLGDDVKNQASADDTTRAGKRTVHVRQRSSTRLLPRYKRKADRREQLRVIDAAALFALSDDNDSEFFTLYHGTTIDLATAMLQHQPRIPTGHGDYDFGNAFYMTDDLAYALETAYQVSRHATLPNGAVDRNKDPAVVAFRVPLARKGELLRGCANNKLGFPAQLLIRQFEPTGGDWTALTAACLRETTGQLPEQLGCALEEAAVVIGAAKPADVRQYAFRKLGLLRRCGCEEDLHTLVLRLCSATPNGTLLNDQ